MNQPLRIETDGHIATWTIDVPDAANAVSRNSFITALDTAVDDVNSNTDIRTVILTGHGRFFSAGGNMHDISAGDGVFGLDAIDQRHGYISGIQRIPRAMMRCEVPVIAAVNGPAIGAGCDLAMMCDIRIASESAYFAESFVQLGLIPGDGGAWFLPRAVGHARAAEMTFTGDRVDATTAHSWGLINSVHSDQSLMDAALELAARIAKNPPRTLRMAKALLNQSRAGSLDALLNLSASMQSLAHQDPDHRARVAAWQQRGRTVTA
jgi:enoyl-CoA hydratase/carnithine racemase